MHPARHFILFLFSTQRDADKANVIKKALERHRLYPLAATKTVLEHLKEQATWPDKYDPAKKTSKVSTAFWRKLRIYDMHCKTAAVKNAVEILSTPTIREIVEPLLLSGTPFADVRKIVLRKTYKAYRADDIATYYHYFFDVSAISRAEWGTLIREESAGHHVLESALLADHEVIRWRIGDLNDVRLDLREGLNEAFTQSYMRLKELRQLPTTPNVVKMMNQLVDSLLKANQGLVDQEVGKADLLEKLASFRQHRVQVQPVSVHQLGAFSGASRLSDGGEVMHMNAEDADGEV